MTKKLLDLRWHELELTEYVNGSMMILESASTPGGWLYRTVITNGDGFPVSVSLAWAPAVKAGTKQAKAHSWKRKPAPAEDYSGLEDLF